MEYTILIFLLSFQFPFGGNGFCGDVPESPDVEPDPDSFNSLSAGTGFAALNWTPTWRILRTCFQFPFGGNGFCGDPDGGDGGGETEEVSIPFRRERVLRLLARFPRSYRRVRYPEPLTSSRPGVEPCAHGRSGEALGSTSVARPGTAGIADRRVIRALREVSDLEFGRSVATERVWRVPEAFVK